MEYKYKIHLGYDQNNFIPIDEDELPRAIAAHMTGGKAAFRQGSVSGTQITAVTPDWHAALGYSYGYRFQPEDWGDVKPLRARYSRHQEAVSQYVKQAIESNRPQMIDRPYPQIIAELRAGAKQPNALVAGAKELAAKMSMRNTIGHQESTKIQEDAAREERKA